MSEPARDEELLMDQNDIARLLVLHLSLRVDRRPSSSSSTTAERCWSRLTVAWSLRPIFAFSKHATVIMVSY
jgi:hypothetical protein